MVIEEKELKRTHKYIFTNAKNNVSYALLSKLQNTFVINNRRYLGNKYKLNEFIKETIIRECGEFATFADLFAGTGAVAAMFQNKHLIVNDILYSNFVCYQTWFGNENYSLKKISNYINKYNSSQHEKINKELNIKSYFCKPYHSWEKGTVENINGLIRRFFPKGTDFDTITEEQIAYVEDWIKG